MANAIVGSLEIILIASLLGLPIAILAGVFLAETRGNYLATLVRFVSDVMTGVPSIVAGIFVWS